MEEGYKTIGCKFPNTERVYTYKYNPVFIGRELVVGDRVMVDTKNGHQAVDVSEVHETPKPEDKFKIKEILSWVNPQHEV